MFFDITMRDRPLLVIAVLIAVGTFLLLYSFQSPNVVPEEAAPVQTVSLATDEFGMPISELSVIESTVRRNETFSDLLNPYGVAYERIVTLARQGRCV